MNFIRLAPWCVLGAALAGCGGSSGGTSGSVETTRTLAYVVTDCREDAGGFHADARLEVRRGDADPIIIKENPTIGPIPVHDPPLCRFIGEGRRGGGLLVASSFQRLGVSPDGSRVVFELTDDFSILSRDQLPPEEEGIYVVHADGSGLRRLVPASREPTFHIVTNPILFWVYRKPIFGFSPSGDRITYADHGPDRSGRQAVQIMTLNLDTGERRQITRLPPQPPSTDLTLFFIDSPPFFLDEETIAFVTHVEPGGLAAYTVKASGDEEPVPLPPPLSLPGSELVPGFLITDAARSVYALRLGSVYELFASDGRTLTQLTSFGLADTAIEAVLSRDRRRVLFPASADLGGNPYKNCQFFSVDTLGGDLRQLTSFDEGQPAARNGCDFAFPRPLGCSVGIVGRDRKTDTIVFESSCDPFGTNPNGGQLFAMEFDGTGLRQLTHTRGFEIAADGTVTVELPGPAAYNGGL